MDLDALSADERRDALAEMADLYYNQQLTQIEIARRFDTTRFKVAKLLQDARDEQVVEIRVNFSNERNAALERELMEAFPLRCAIVANTQYSAYIDSLRQMGQLGAAYVDELLEPGSTLGLTWGKTIQPVVAQLPQTGRRPINAVQLTGCFETPRPSSESRELVRLAATAYSGTTYYLDAPLYVSDPELRERLAAEPLIKRAIDAASKLDVVLTGIGGSSSLPVNNPAFRHYVTDADLAAAGSCVGSLYGYALDASGEVASIDLNEKLMAAPISDILRAPHRIGVTSGRHKARISTLVIRSGLINELVTDTETAQQILAYA